MKYVNQLLYRHIPYLTRTKQEGKAWEYGQTTTVASSGCGLCSAVMVADRLLVDSNFDVEDAVALSYSVEANHNKGTDYKIFAPAFAEKMGFHWEGTNDPEKLLDCLRTGGAAVAHIGGNREGHVGVFSKGGHYVAVISVEPDGRVVVLDPSYKEGKYEEEGRKGLVELKNGVMAVCDIQVLIDDTASRDPHYHLFWRK